MESFWRELPEEIVSAISKQFALDENRIRAANVMIQRVTGAALARVAAWHRGRERLARAFEASGADSWGIEIARAWFENAPARETLRRRSSAVLDAIFEADRLALTEFFAEKTALPIKAVSHIFSYGFPFLIASLRLGHEAGESQPDAITYRLRRAWDALEAPLTEQERAFLEQALLVRRRGLDSGGYPVFEGVPEEEADGGEDRSDLDAIAASQPDCPNEGADTP